jgi:hypothetical protein
LAKKGVNSCALLKSKTGISNTKFLNYEKVRKKGIEKP